VALGDVVNQFHDEHSLADTSTAEQANLTSLGVWGKHINDLDASDEHFSFDLHVNKLWGIGVNWPHDLLANDWATFVNGLTNDVHDTAEGAVTDWDLDRVTGVDDPLATDEAFGTVHGNSTDGVLTKMLCDFENESDVVVLHLKGVEDRWDLTIELDVDDGTNDSSHLTGGGSGGSRGGREGT